MKGADMWDIAVRYETSLPLHVGCDLEPDASSAPTVRGTSGVEDMWSRWVSQAENSRWHCRGGIQNEMDGRKNITAVPRVDVNSGGNGISRASQITQDVSRCSKFGEAVSKIQKLGHVSYRISRRWLRERQLAYYTQSRRKELAERTVKYKQELLSTQWKT